jgi:hypothetical protein
MYCLFNLPDAILVETFSHWIDLESLVHFDTATCNESQRIELLSLFNSYEFQKAGNWNYNFVSFSEQKIFDWILSKNIKCQVIMFDETLSATWMTKKNKLNQYSVINATKYATALSFSSLNFSNIFQERHIKKLMISIIHSSTQLAELIINDCFVGNSILKSVLPKVLEKLKVLKLGWCHDSIHATHKSISYVTQHCHNLLHFHIFFKEKVAPDKVTEDQIIPLLAANPLLKSVSLSLKTNLTNKLLTTIATHCPTINVLEVFSLTTDDFLPEHLQTFLSATKVDSLFLYHSGDSNVVNFLSFNKHPDMIWLRCCHNMNFMKNFFLNSKKFISVPHLMFEKCAIQEKDELFHQIVKYMGKDCKVDCF